MSTTPPSTARPDLQTLWQARSAPFTAEVEAVADWSSPSPCEGWSAWDVLAHVLETERDFLTRHGLLEVREDAAGGGADGEADGTGEGAAPAGASEPAALWADHLRQVTALLTDPASAEHSFDGAFGPTTVGATLIDFYGFDLIVHRWDLARSQDREVRFSAEELALVDAAVEGWGEHAYGPGIFAPALSTTPGADEQTRVLARTGRRG